ncbi:MAG: hypothetical protein ACRYFS_21690 [Janthinobacterium lividum]
MAPLQKDIDSKSLDHPVAPKNPEREEALPELTEADARDEQLWESTSAASQDMLAHLAARSRAHCNSGSTKKVGAKKVGT